MTQAEFLSDLISTGSAARLLGRSRSTVERLIKAGTLPGVYVAPSWVTLRSEVVRLVQDRVAADVERISAVSELSPTLVEL
jgi:hypothetical protein